jgi:hypothetical protein
MYPSYSLQQTHARASAPRQQDLGENADDRGDQLVLAREVAVDGAGAELGPAEEVLHRRRSYEWRGLGPQRTAFFTSVPIFASSLAVSSFSAKAVGHMTPSSRFAVSLKPNVAYLALNLSALWKKQTTLPSLA